MMLQGVSLPAKQEPPCTAHRSPGVRGFCSSLSSYQEGEQSPAWRGQQAGRGDPALCLLPPVCLGGVGAVPRSSDCRQMARDGIPTGSSSHSTEKWSYLSPGEGCSVSEAHATQHVCMTPCMTEWASESFHTAGCCLCPQKPCLELTPLWPPPSTRRKLIFDSALRGPRVSGAWGAQSSLPQALLPAASCGFRALALPQGGATRPPLHPPSGQDLAWNRGLFYL